MVDVEQTVLDIACRDADAVGLANVFGGQDVDALLSHDKGNIA